MVANDITSLENCAVLLEALRLQGQRDTNGAFQGYYLTVDDDRISSSTSPRTFGYPILQPPQREEIDRDLRRLIKERGGKMPDPGDVSVERQ